MVKLGLFKNLEWFLTFYKGDPPSFLTGSLFGKKALAYNDFDSPMIQLGLS